MVHQDIALYAAVLERDQSLSYEMRPGRTLYIQVARGSIRLGGAGETEQTLSAGDAAMAEMEQMIRVEATQDAEVLVFDLPVGNTASAQGNTH